MGKTQPCKFFARGSCTNPQCTFLHDGAAATEVATRAPSQIKAVEASMADGRHEKLTVEKSRRQLVFSCAIDTSGSMAGGRLRAAIAALTDLCENAMDGEDRYALAAFADSVTKLHGATPRSGIDVAHDMRAVERASGGRTALWDGVHSAITSAQAYQASLGGNRTTGPQPVYE